MCPVVYLQEGGIKTSFHMEKTWKKHIQPRSARVRIFFKAILKFSFWILRDLLC